MGFDVDSVSFHGDSEGFHVDCCLLSHHEKLACTRWVQTWTEQGVSSKWSFKSALLRVGASVCMLAHAHVSRYAHTHGGCTFMMMALALHHLEQSFTPCTQCGNIILTARAKRMLKSALFFVIVGQLYPAN